MFAVFLAVAYAALCGYWLAEAAHERQGARQDPGKPTADELEDERHERAQRAAWRAYDRVYTGRPADVDQDQEEDVK